ncbi:hypothetical protein EFK50_15160 [Nocardioides marmoriginsengisoli]|uniref:Uncharacterized protein n=1 Tax=Nocardioides marmoriginsengisoli TaxID=661483 RepID=A0A3N0CIF4_9ACTN|nr:hypothetical protein [Nocardioides marmoriginsengisoli]RNL63051.1 hypothetical protein EFK50_15160 [Nocardioides marmoriginsengisoli]
METVGPWLLLAGFLFLSVKAYGYVRDRFGTSDRSALEGIGALWLAPVVAPFMPFVWLHHWSERRREAIQVRAGGGPLTDDQRRDRSNLVVGGVLVILAVAVVGYLLLFGGPPG